MNEPGKAVVFHPGIIIQSLLRMGLLILLLLAANHSQATDDSTYYASWTKPWAERPTTSAALNNTELKAVVSTVTGEADANKVADMTPAERINLAYHIKVASTEIATNGSYREYFVSNTSTKSTALRQFPEADLQKITNLLAQLPDDNAQLPLAGRRVVVQTLESGQWHVRVYDGKKLPSEVQSLLEQLANPDLLRL